MTRKFIRTLWGIYDHKGVKQLKRRTKLDADIKLLLRNKFNEPFITYVFGEDNYKFLIDRGFDCKLVDKKPIVWDLKTQAFRHKIEAFKCGMDDYNKIVFLDWDTLPVKPLPNNFWKVLGNKKKAPIQAVLRNYHRRKAHWRPRNVQRRIPCASFVYIRDKQIPYDLITLWEKMGKPWSEEIVMAKYMDEMVEGWQGKEKYWKYFEPNFFSLEAEGRCYDWSLLHSKNICFKHFNKKSVQALQKKLHKGAKNEVFI